MLFIKGTQLTLTYTQANWPDPDVDRKEFLIFPGAGNPRAAYGGLKGAAPSMAWPQGSTIVPFDSNVPGFGNNLLTDAFGDYGVRNWQITAPGNSYIPGKLQIAFYLNSNLDDTAPDSVAEYVFGGITWTTGDLFVFTGSFSSSYYRAPRFRFIPGPLIIPLGV